MNVAVYCPVLKLSGLRQREPLGLLCWQLPFGLAGDASLARPWHAARQLSSAQHGSKQVCTKKKKKSNVLSAGTVQRVRFLSVEVFASAT